MLDEGLRDMFVTKHESEHDWVSDVKFVKRFYAHKFSFKCFGSCNIYVQIWEKPFLVNFANNSYQNASFCQLLIAKKFVTMY